MIAIRFAHLLINDDLSRNHKLSAAGQHLLWLLVKQSEFKGILTKDDIKYTTQKKPYFDFPFHFSIAHAQDIAICATDNKETGIDIEYMRPVNFTDYEDYFTHREWAVIKGDSEPLSAFFGMWVRKEAILKATGQGLLIPLKSIEVINNDVLFNGEQWYLQDILIADGYKACLASRVKCGRIDIAEVKMPNY